MSRCTLYLLTQLRKKPRLPLLYSLHEPEKAFYLKRSSVHHHTPRAPHLHAEGIAQEKFKPETPPTEQKALFSIIRQSIRHAPGHWENPWASPSRSSCRPWAWPGRPCVRRCSDTPLLGDAAWVLKGASVVVEPQRSRSRAGE